MNSNKYYDKEGYDREGYDREGYDKNGFDMNGINKITKTIYDINGYGQYGYDREGYNKEGYSRGGYDKEGYNKEGYDRKGYDRYGYDKKGFHKNGIHKITKTIYDTNGYNVYGYDKEGYNKEGYDRKGYDKEGYSRYGYDKEGYDREGYDENGFDKNGGIINRITKTSYDMDGYDRYGYDKKGFDKNGIHKITKTIYDTKGYDRHGYDKKGYDQEGYDQNGYDKDGYNENGYNRRNFDRNGINCITKTKYDREGYDIEGYDEEGYNKKGYDREGYDKEGYNKEGYDREGYDKEGYDKGGYDKEGYDKEDYDINEINKEGINKKTGEKDKRIAILEDFLESQKTISEYSKENGILQKYLEMIVDKIGKKYPQYREKVEARLNANSNRYYRAVISDKKKLLKGEMKIEDVRNIEGIFSCCTEDEKKQILEQLLKAMSSHTIGVMNYIRIFDINEINSKTIKLIEDKLDEVNSQAKGSKEKKFVPYIREIHNEKRRIESYSAPYIPIENEKIGHMDSKTGQVQMTQITDEQRDISKRYLRAIGEFICRRTMYETLPKVISGSITEEVIKRALKEKELHQLKDKSEELDETLELARRLESSKEQANDDTKEINQ